MMNDKIVQELKEWIIVFNDNIKESTHEDISELQAEEINSYMMEDGYIEKQIMEAWDYIIGGDYDER